MQITFAGQPFADQENLFDFVTKALADDHVNEINVVVAWAKRSGLLRLQEALEDFSVAGGRSLIIVGIDEGGATKQGLRLCIDLFDETFIFHDPSWRTFHPKIYLAKSDTSARLLVGSNNLTAGGVFFNYEAALNIELDLTKTDDLALHDNVQKYIDRLLAEKSICLPLNEDLLNSLVANPKIRLGDEDATSKPTTDGPEDTDESPHTDDTDVATSPFGKPQEPKRPDPHPVQGDGGGTARPPAPRRPRAPAPASAPTAGAAAATSGQQPPAAKVVRRWTKRLAKSDAQQPAPGSNPTGNLRLTKASHPINWRTFFRDQLFLPAQWRATQDNWGNPIEVADVDFEVEFGGANLGIHTLRVDHAPHRESGQANHVTVLHWDDLITELQRTNFVGHYVVIERLSDGTYRLQITRADPGAIL